MNIQEIRKEIESISLNNGVKTVDYGEDFLLATGKGIKYPLSFFELPLTVDYAITGKPIKEFKFALLILDRPSFDNIKTDFQTISEMEVLGDTIIGELQTVSDLGITSVNGLSLREFSDDNVSGMRYEITVNSFRTCK